MVLKNLIWFMPETMFLIHIFKSYCPYFALNTFNNSVLAFSSEKWREILKSGTCAGAGDFCVAWEAHGGALVAHLSILLILAPPSG
jgi:hypothetical protein